MRVIIIMLIAMRAYSDPIIIDPILVNSIWQKLLKGTELVETGLTELKESQEVFGKTIETLELSLMKSRVFTVQINMELSGLKRDLTHSRADLQNLKNLWKSTTQKQKIIEVCLYILAGVAIIETSVIIVKWKGEP